MTDINTPPVPPSPYTNEAITQPKKSRKVYLAAGIALLIAFVAGIIIGAASAGGPTPTATPGQTVTATVQVPGETVTVTPEPEAPAASTTCVPARTSFLISALDATAV